MLYDRKIKYLDYFENGERVRGGGFAKLEMREGQFLLQLTVKGLHGTDSFLRDVVVIIGGKESVLGQIALKEGDGTFQYQGSLGQVSSGQENPGKGNGETKTGYEDLQGIKISISNTREVRCIWGGKSESTGIMREMQEPGSTGAMREMREKQEPGSTGVMREMREKQGPGSTGAMREMREKQGPGSTGAMREMKERRESGSTGSMREVREKQESGSTGAMREMREKQTPGSIGSMWAVKEKQESGSTGMTWKAGEGRKHESADFMGEMETKQEPTKQEPDSPEKEMRMAEAGEVTTEKRNGQGDRNGWPVKTDLRDNNKDAARTGLRDGNGGLKERGEGQSARETGNRMSQTQTRPVKLMEDKWLQLSAIYPHVQPFKDERDYLSIRPGDFVLLSSRSYQTANNSFLLHGYYNYHHLILTRVDKRGEVLYYLGVPGNYYAKEKQVAVMFGFESFESAQEPAQMGDFGYYMMRVEL